MNERKKYYGLVLRKTMPVEFEAWFEGQAAKGWFPLIDIHSFFVMRFAKGEPKKYRYIIDYQKKSEDEYIQTYTDFGWEFVGVLSRNYFIWRKEYDNERPEAFTDYESIRHRNRTFIKQVIISFLSFTALCFVATSGVINGITGYGTIRTVFSVTGLCFIYTATAAHVPMISKIIQNIGRNKS